METYLKAAPYDRPLETMVHVSTQLALCHHLQLLLQPSNERTLLCYNLLLCDSCCTRTAI